MKKALLLIAFLYIGMHFLLAQTVQIKGTVTSAEDGSPIPGAAIQIKGTLYGVITDSNGKFQLDVPKGSQSLIVSFIGMKSIEITIGDKTELNIALEPDVIGLDEVIVTALGIQRSQKSLGYTVSSLSGDETVMKSEPDLLRAIEGKLPGVDIKSTQGAPGASTRINIRGFSSFFGNNEPLIVVDGIPYSNDEVVTSNQVSGNGGAYLSGLATLDPNTIEDVNILYGGTAAALYGSRAANGVIIIKTKAGSTGKIMAKKGIGVTFNSSTGWEKISNLPEYQNTYGNGAEFNYSNANGSWGPRFDSMDSIPVWPAYKKAFPNLFPGDSVAYVAQPNNVKSLFRTGHIYENSITISGANDRSSFNTTASMLNHYGYIPESEFDRYSFSLGGMTKLNEKFTASSNFSYSRVNQIGSFFGENQFDGAASSFARNLFLGRTWDMTLPYEDKDGRPVSTNPTQYDHPLWAFKHNKITTISDRTMMGLNLDYTFLPWISLKYSIGINNYTLNRKEVTDIGSRAAAGLGQIKEANYVNTEIESNFYIFMVKQINQNINLKATLGHNVNQRTSTEQNYIGKEIIFPGIYDIDNTKSVVTDGGDYNRRRLWAVFGDISMSYKEFLFLNFTGRNDVSSTLPPESRSYFYPSVSTSFIFSDALNIKSKIFNLGKLRLGYAQVGNDAPVYALYDVYSIEKPFLGQPIITTPSVKLNPKLKPERTNELEVGLLTEFINSRISLDVTWYNKVSFDQIAPVEIPRSTGYLQYYTNFGKLRNRGIQINLKLTPIQLANSLKWDISANFYKNNSKILELMKGVERIYLADLDIDVTPVLEPNQPYGALRGSYALRDPSTNALIINPVTGFPFLAKGEKIIGNPNPDYKVGISNTISFKGLSLSFLFDYTKGGDIYSVTISSLLGRGVTKDTEDREHAWIIPGYYGKEDGSLYKDAQGNPIENKTLVSTNDLYFYGGGTQTTFAINSAAEYLVYDATVYRLRELTLGYNLPSKIISKLPITGLNISLTGRNLWYFAPNVPKYTNFDPEANSLGSSSNIQGIELSCAPSAKRYSINLRISF